MPKTTKLSKEVEEAIELVTKAKLVVNAIATKDTMTTKAEKAKAKKVAEAVMEEAINAAIRTIDAKGKVD